MEVQEQIIGFKEFIEQSPDRLAKLLENSRKYEKHFCFDYFDLLKLNPELAEDLLTLPEDTIKAFEMSIEQFDLPGANKNFQILIKNLPKSQNLLIAEKRNKHYNQLLCFQGVVRVKSKVLTHAISIRFECPACGNVITVLQTAQDKKIKPSRCGCGRKGKFRQLSEDRIDFQALEIEELPENLASNAQPQKLRVMLKENLVSPIQEQRITLGSKVLINGILKQHDIKKQNVETPQADFLLDAVYVENIDHEDVDLIISPEDRQRIDEIANSPDYLSKLIGSLVPSIHGHERIKEGLLLQQVGGVKVITEDGTQKRGDIHILVIGDPGSGKSQMLKRMHKLRIGSRFASGKGASGVGLTAAVVKDEFIGGWTVQAGALVLANKNVCVIDELDKMSTEDRSHMHEAMEGQTIPVNKAGVQATLTSECSILAGANPKYGRFDEFAKSLAEQIDLPITLINRFDLVFPVRDMPDRDKDEKIFRQIANNVNCSGCSEPLIDTSLLRKYLNIAKNINPIVSKEAENHLCDYYLNLRSKSDSNNAPITARQVEGLFRLAKAHAKLRLSNTVDENDAQKAINIMMYCFSQIAKDDVTGEVDFEKFTTGISSRTRNAVSLIREVIEEIESEVGKVVPVEEIIIKATEKGQDEQSVVDALDMMKKKGELTNSKAGHVMRL